MAAPAAPLALPAAAQGEETGWRRRQDLVDALPYVDSLTAEEKAAADALIEAEMRAGARRPADYLSEAPAEPRSRGAEHPLLAAELARAAAGAPLAALDLARYGLERPPPERAEDPAAWHAALDNAHAQLEHQRTRLLNLELLLKFGPAAWRAHNEALAAHGARTAGEAAAARADVEALNRERKLQQMAAGHELAALEAEYLSAAQKNAEVAAAADAMEAEVAALRARLPPAVVAATEAAAAEAEEGLLA